MKLHEITNISEQYTSYQRGPLDQEKTETSQVKDTENDTRDKVLMTDRGDNYKKAKRLASNARTDAKATNKDKQPPKDQEVIQGADDTPHTSQGNVQHDWRGGR